MSVSNRVRPLSTFAISLAIILVVALTGNAKTTSDSRTAPSSGSTNGVTLNLADFGAVGNGVVDNGPAFQSALDALVTAGGGTLLVPAGSYLVATPVVKDFSSLAGGSITIRGVPSSTMPAPPSASGQELSEGLDLTSEIIPATGPNQVTFTLSHLSHLLVEHIGFTGRPSQFTDALITLYFVDIDDAKIRHCEFYGLSTFGVTPELGGGNLVRAVDSELSIELSVFLGCTANSGAYGALVENLYWRKFNINNSIFLDYGQRTFFGKTGLGAPLSWIDIGNATAVTPDSPRREFVVRDTFLDEGGWVGISAFPSRWGPFQPIHLVYISGLKMNVSNFVTTGHALYDLQNVLIERSHYGWSHNAYAAIDMHKVSNAILDNLTCIDHANRLLANENIGQLTVINSQYSELLSNPQTTTVLNTSPENDPVQYVRQQYLSVLGRQPDPAAHFYWSNTFISCGPDANCVNEKRAVLSEYLHRNPQTNFSLLGAVVDENGNPMSGMTVTLGGLQSVATTTDSAGQFRFSNLPTSGSYPIAGHKGHYSFAQTIALPTADLSVTFNATLDHHSIRGRVVHYNGTPLSGVALQLAQAPATTATDTATTDENGNYSFSNLPAGFNYTVVPTSTDLIFGPGSRDFQDLSADQTANFFGQQRNISIEGKVIDEFGNPLSEVEVRLSGPRSANALTDSWGNFRFTELPTSSNTYTVEVNKRHYSFETSSKTFAFPIEDVSVTFNARLNRHSINGRITRANGTPISGVSVQFAQSPTTTVTTDESGSYSFPNLPAGLNYTVVPTSADFIFTPVNKDFQDLSADQTADFVGQLKNISIEGEVIDENGNPLDNVDIRLTGSQSAVVVTASTGSFRFSSLPTNGNYTVTVSKRHYHFSNNGQTFNQPAESLSVTFCGELNHHSINGQITRSNGTGISGVAVRLMQPTLVVTTDANGSYSFQNLPAGQNYSVVPFLSGFEFTSQNSAIVDLSEDVTSNFLGKLKPELLMVEGSDLAIALESLSFVTQPVSIFNSLALGSDQITRVIVFGRNFENYSDPTQVSLVAVDDEGNTYPLEIEKVSEIAAQPSLKQINFKLSEALPRGTCLMLRLSVAGVQSNIPKICIASGP